MTTEAAARPAVANGAPIIEVRGLVKRYGDLIAVNGIDLTVDQGEIFGILGPNGAGKTTTLEMIEGLRVPDAGTIRVAGIDAVAEPTRLRKSIGAQLQTTALFDYLSATELIKLFCGLYGVDDSPARVDELVEMVNLKEKRSAKVNELSGGQRQRLAITLSLVNRPVVAFLDEPTTGLDPAARRSLWDTIRGVRDAGTTVVLTTHYMEEAEVLCDRIAIFDQGRLIACDTTQNLIRRLDKAATIKATLLSGSLDDASLRALPAATGASINVVSGGHPELSIETTDVQQSLVGLLGLSGSQGVELGDLRSTQASLEDVFLDLTGRSYEQHDDKPAETEEKKGRRGRRAA